MPKKKIDNKKKLQNKEEVKPGKKINRLLGMKDIIPSDHYYFSLLCEKAKELAEIYSFSSIKTPLMENINLYKNSIRKTNEEKFYTIEAEKGETAVLRPELTQ